MVKRRNAVGGVENRADKMNINQKFTSRTKYTLLYSYTPINIFELSRIIRLLVIIILFYFKNP